jgi:FkbM family methyltransferase
VVALEPNPLCQPTLRYLFGRNRHVTLLDKAVGSSPGTAHLHVAGTASTASLRDDWSWNGRGARAVSVQVVTLQDLIAEHGTPRLLKVDVEGFEEQVFQGLHQAISTVYFEMHSSETTAVGNILARLAVLGTVGGVNAVSEDHSRWLLNEWVSGERFLESLTPLPAVANVVVRMRTDDASPVPVSPLNHPSGA